MLRGCIDIALMMEVTLLLWSHNRFFLRSSILFICSIKGKTCKLQEQGLLIKRDMLKRMMVMLMLMQLFLLNMIECSMVRIEEEARKRSRTD